MPNRKVNDGLRGRFHLTEAEISRKATALRDNHYGFRDATMISLAFRSCLRVGELVNLTWDSLNFEEGTIHIRRLKGSDPSTHKLQGDMQAMRSFPGWQSVLPLPIYHSQLSRTSPSRSPQSGWQAYRFRPPDVA
jgi:integrase